MNNNALNHILKASAIIGASSFVTIVCGVIKTKAIALMLGPAGIGLLGLLLSIQNTAGTVAGMGLASSGAREYSIASADNNLSMLYLTRKSLVVLSFIFGSIVTLIVFLCRNIVADFSFKHPDAPIWIGIVAIGVFSFAITASQTALLNGLHRIKAFAMVTMAGNVIGVTIGISAICLYKTTGIAVAVMAVPTITAIAGWLYCRRLVEPVEVFSVSQIISHQKKLIALGFVFMSTALITSITHYFVRIMLVRVAGIDATGCFQAAWNISMLYLGFVLNAMATDYYPRLSAVSKDPMLVNKMVNEQAEVALLLTGPVILFSMTGAEFIVKVLYSGKFQSAIEIFRWQTCGDFLKVATWPLGYVLFARGMGKTVLLSELSWNLVYLFVIYYGVKIYGIGISGISFFIAYIYYFLLIYFLVNRATQFRLSRENKRLIVMLAMCLLAVFILQRSAPKLGLLIGGALTTIMSWYSLSRFSVSLFRKDK